MTIFSQFTPTSFSVGTQLAPNSIGTTADGGYSFAQVPAGTSFLDYINHLRNGGDVANTDLASKDVLQGDTRLRVGLGPIRSLGTTADGGYDFSQVPRGTSYLDYINHLRNGGAVASTGPSPDFDFLNEDNPFTA